MRKNIGEKGQSVEDQLEIADFLKVIENHPDVFPSTVRPGTTLFEALHETREERNAISHATDDKSEHDAREFLGLLSEFLKACGETGHALQIEKDYIAQLGETPPASLPASRESSGEDYIAQLGETPLAPSSACHESQAPRKATAGLVSKPAMSLALVLVVGIVAAVAVVYLFALRDDTADTPPQQVPAIANAEPSEGNGTTPPSSSAESQQVQPAAPAEQSDDGEPVPEDNTGNPQSVQGAGDAAAPQQTQPQDADDPGNGGPSQHDDGGDSQPAQVVPNEEQTDSDNPPRQDGDGSDASTAESSTNRQPECDPIADLKIDEGNDEQIFLNDYCTNTNPDGGGLEFSASPSDDRVASLDEQPTGDRGRLSIYGEGSGTATIIVTATDPSSGESAEMSFAVTVLGRIDCPIIDDVWANRGDADQAIDLNCSDPEDPERQHILTYKASSNAPDVADVSVSGSTLTISFGKPGRADVRYTATSSDGRSVSREFEVVVD